MKLRLARAEDDEEIDLTPLIDCIFLLVLFFMVTSSFIEESKAFKIELPRAEKAQTISQENTLAISVTTDGRYFLRAPGDKEAKQVKNLGEVLARLEQGKARGERPAVIVRCDAKAEYQHYVQVVNALKVAGVENFFQEVEVKDER